MWPTAPGIPGPPSLLPAQIDLRENNPPTGHHVPGLYAMMRGDTATPMKAAPALPSPAVERGWG